MKTLTIYGELREHLLIVRVTYNSQTSGNGDITMKIINLLTIFILVLSGTSISRAAPAGVVEGLQMPAWLERGSVKQPIKPGMRLQSGDRVFTGQNAKLLLRLEEGSHVKMGQNARINMDKLSPPKEESGLFSGLMNVVKGAFRFTTTSIGIKRKRAVDIKIGTFTAGIRGTDIWGRSTNEKDLVCLIEGNISVESEGQSFTMSDPLTFYVKPKDAPADPVGPVDEEQLKKWAMETELLDGDGVIRQQGNYFINLMSLTSRDLAEQNQARFHAAGFATDLQEASVDGTQWYRLRITNLFSKADATSLATAMQEQFGLGSVWIDRG